MGTTYTDSLDTFLWFRLRARAVLFALPVLRLWFSERFTSFCRWNRGMTRGDSVYEFDVHVMHYVYCTSTVFIARQLGSMAIHWRISVWRRHPPRSPFVLRCIVDIQLI